MEKDADQEIELAGLLRPLSKLGALGILKLAAAGIASSTDAMRGLRLTQKQYYSRLRELVEAGLVEKRGGAYVLTSLGRVLQGRLIPALLRAIEGREHLRLLDELEAADFDDYLKREAAKAIGARGVVGLLEGSTVKVIDNYEVLVKELVVCIENAKSTILLATNYVETRVADAGLRALKRGVRIRTISNGGGASGALSRLRMILSPKIFDALIYYLSNLEEVGEVVRDASVPYSFSVIDGHECFFELPNPVGGGFSLGFKVDDPQIGAILTEIFEELWEGARPNAILKLATARLKGYWQARDNDYSLKDEL